MKLGFSGSRHGLSPQQHSDLTRLLRYYKPAEVHHGMCVGADSIFHRTIREVLGACWIVGHPPNDAKLRDYTLQVDESREPRDYLERDRDIVDESYTMLFGPNGKEDEQPRSGTWYTYRYTKKTGKHYHILDYEGIYGLTRTP